MVLPQSTAILLLRKLWFLLGKWGVMKDNIKILSRFSVLLILSIVLSAGLWGQIGTQATFTGTVKDSSGAIVSGATVTATNIATGESQTSPSNQDGLYRLSQLSPGHYRIQASQTGFRAEVHNDLELTVAQIQEVDFTLEVGSNTETVTVTGEAPLVDTSTSTVSSLVGERQVQDLPLNGRDYSQLLYLTPGVGYGGGNVNVGRANPQFEISGAPAAASRYIMDGAEMSGAGTTSNVLPNTASLKLLGVESVVEFSVVNGNGEASLGKVEGGAINMVSRSGTNVFHGSAYEFFRSNIFDTANYFSPTVLLLTRNNFGGAVGGPIRKNKTFFFGNYEQYESREGQAFVNPLPTPTVLGIGTPNGVEQIPTGAVFTSGGATVCQIDSINPVTGAQSTNGGPAIPNPVLLSSAVQASASLLKFYPAGTNPSSFLNGTPNFSANGCPTGTQNVATETINVFSDHYGLARIDHQISDKQSVFGRYLIQKGTRTNALNDHIDEFGQVWNQDLQLFTVGHRYAFSNGLLHQFTASYNRGFYFIVDGLYPNSHFTQSAIPTALDLLNGTSTDPQKLGTVIVTGGLPNFVASSSGTEFHGVGRSVYEGDEQLSKNVGQHFLQGGVQFQRFFVSNNPTGATDGSLTFPSLLSFAQGVPSTFLGIVPCCANAFRVQRQFYIGTYLQDSYKIRSNLTINVGLRWEFMSIAQERHNRFVDWYPVLGGDGACAATVTCFPAFPAFPYPASFSEPGLVYPASSISPINHSGNWGPRVGFAWNVFGSGKTSVRGGFGLFYNQITINPGATPPYYVPATLNSQVTSATGNVPSIPWGGPVPGTLLQTAIAGIVQPVGTVPNPAVPAMLQYNLTIQQEIAPQTTLSVGYVGNEAYHQYRTGLANMPNVVLNSAGRLAFPSVSNLTCAVNLVAGACPSSTTGPGTLTLYDGTSDFNSLQVTLERRLSHGLQLKAIFAWSKSLADNSDTLAGTPGGLSDASILNAAGYDRGPLPFNVGKNFTLNWIYDLPFGKHDKLVGLALNGWQLSGPPSH